MIIQDVKIVPIYSERQSASMWGAVSHSHVVVYTKKRSYQTTWAGTPTEDEVKAGFIEDHESGKLRNWTRLY